MCLLLESLTSEQEADEFSDIINVDATVRVNVSAHRIGRFLTREQDIDECSHVINVDTAITIDITEQNGRLVKLTQFTLVGLIDVQVGVNTAGTICKGTTDERYDIEVLEFPAGRNGKGEDILIGVAVAIQVITLYRI